MAKSDSLSSIKRTYDSLNKKIAILKNEKKKSAKEVKDIFGIVEPGEVKRKLEKLTKERNKLIKEKKKVKKEIEKALDNMED